jgi:signal transduction histidine kinase/uncharacterized membrane protein YagU involved in acid resistance
MGGRVNYGGVVVAGVGFFMTRFTITLAIYDDPLRFYLAGVVPLALGLGLAAFGVALAVGDVSSSLARTTAVWCVVGATAMLVLVILTLLGSTSEPVTLSSALSRTYLSNFLIGGSVGGALTGLYAARNAQQRRTLQQQTNRLVTLNRLLRHEVLNAVTAIRGWTTIDTDEHPEALSIIDDRSADIQETIEEVKYLTGESDAETAPETPVDLSEALGAAVDRVEQRHPGAEVTVETEPDPGLRVSAHQQIDEVFGQLLENAIVHAGADPEVTVRSVPSRIRVSIADDGPGLPDSQQRLLEAGDIEEFDDPTKGFGLNLTRLYVESAGGDIETTVDDTGTTVTVTLRRVQRSASDLVPSRPELTRVQPALPHLAVSLVAALVAGVPYGVVSELLGGSVAGIGVFYGTATPLVGWLTHEFHSVVFGFVYTALLAFAFERYRDRLVTYLGVGVLWSLFLWVVAAGVVGPVWLHLLGIPVPVPSFSGRLLAAHLAWGTSLSLLTAAGYRYLGGRLPNPSPPR